jgi:eukaryotic-like serine/threonine-protein kinase
LRKPDIAKDAVLDQLYNNQSVKPGTRLFMGSTVSFVLGDGLGEDEMDVPVVIGMTFAEAKAYLASYGLNVGGLIVDSDVKDTARSFVTKQFPEKKTLQGDGSMQLNKIRPGQAMDIWLGTERIIVVNEDSLGVSEQ